MSEKKIQVLLVTGGPYHDAPESIAGLQNALVQRCDVTQTEKVADLGELADGRFDVAVIYTTHREGELTDALAETLEKFVANGGGLVGVHAATGSFTDNERYMKLIGAQFEGHGPVVEFTVRPTDPEHPVVARTDAFRITDELYLMKDHADYETFAVAHWQGQDRPMGYERQVGKGKVLYLGNGHDARATHNPHFQRMLERAVRVAAGETYDTKITAGVLGYGGAFNMGKAHSEAIRAQPGMDVTAVCDIDPRRTEQAKTELGDSIKTWNDPEAFLTDGEFDLCIQILPHNLHAAYCIKASEGGKHVVTEKPFCVTLQEADDMIAASRKAGKMLSCFHNRRWNGDFHTMLKMIRAGKIGEVFRIDAAMGGYAEPRTWWRSSKEISGGLMYDWGAHYMDWTLNFANKRIKSVTGDFQKRKWHHVTNEDFTYALVRFEDDTTATLEQNTLNSVPKGNGWRVLGTEGGLANDGPGGEITWVHFEQGQRVEGRMPVPKSSWAAYYANVGNHLIMDERLVVTPEQARRAIGVIYLAEQSAKKGGEPLELPGEADFEPNYMIPW